MTQERVMFVGGMLAAAFVGGGLSSAVFTDRVMAQGSPSAVTTGQVNLVSRAGRIRGILSAEDERGMASLTLYDEAGQMRSALAIGPDGTPACSSTTGPRPRASWSRSKTTNRPLSSPAGPGTARSSAP